MKKLSLIGILIVSVAFIGACGGDGTSTPESNTTLTENQAKTVASAMTDSIGTVFESLESATGSPKLSVRSQESASAEIEATATCDGGGSVTVTGQASASTSNSNNNVEASYEITQTFDNCKTGDEGETITLDGSVTSEGDMDITVEPFSGTVSSKTTGSVDVSGDNITSGTCGININASATVSETGAEISYSGSICGVSLNFEATETFDDE